MMNNFPLLIAALAWTAFGMAMAAESTLDPAANPSSVTTQAETTVGANVIADAPVTCEYGCEDHREGTEICINRKQHRCDKHGWQPTGLACVNPPPVIKK